MARGIMYVESGPVSPDRVDEFHAWYEQHIGELLQLDGFLSVRRFAVLGDDSTFVAMYDIEGDDLAAVQARVGEARKAGRTTPPTALRTDPPPTVRLLELMSESA
jgi:hypothetical protein